MISVGLSSILSQPFGSLKSKSSLSLLISDHLKFFALHVLYPHLSYDCAFNAEPPREKSTVCRSGGPAGQL